MTKEHDNIAVSALVVILIVAWLAFGFHENPRFAGSAWGGFFAVTGTLLMLVPLAYMIIKRIRPLKKAVIKFVPMRKLLTWHIYAGVIGPILVLIHTGHKFRSPLGISLTAMTIIVVLSGFVGRYLMSHISSEINEKKSMLAELNEDYQNLAAELAEHPEEKQEIRPFSGFISRLFATWILPSQSVASSTLPVQLRAVRLADSIADLEYAVRTHQTFKKAFSRWLKLHIVLSLVLYVLIALHIWASIHFGLRWFHPTSHNDATTKETTSSEGNRPPRRGWCFMGSRRVGSKPPFRRQRRAKRCEPWKTVSRARLIGKRLPGVPYTGQGSRGLKLYRLPREQRGRAQATTDFLPCQYRILRRVPPRARGACAQKVAGDHHAKVEQCYRCHQTPSWNDIKRAGWYKHH